VAVKIKLKRMGKMRNAQYRIVIADARTKRDGRAIEEIGIYQPKEEPSLIKVDSARAQYWLGVGAQPTEAVTAILKVTGDWQKFKGLPGAEGTLRVAEPKTDKKTLFEAAALEAASEPLKAATTPKKKATAAVVDAPAAEVTEAPADVAPAAEVTDAPADVAPAAEVTQAPADVAPAAEVTEAPADDAPTTEAAAADAPAADAPAAESTEA
jgi:small subunit ribosomal protein S16